MGELVYSGLERLVNSTLRTDPDTLEALAVLSGKVLLLEFAGTDIRIYICPAEEGLELKPEQPGGANVCIRGRVSDLIAYLMASRGLSDSFSGSLAITGDIPLAQKFQSIMKDFEFDWEAKIAVLTGDLAARRVTNFLRGAAGFALHTGKILQADLSEYLRYEKQILPDRSAIQEHYGEVRRLENDVAALERRIDRLRNLAADKV